MVTVIHGPDHESADVAGRTVEEVRTSYENIFNIGREAVPLVNNKQVTDEYVLGDGDKLTFEADARKFRAA